MDEFKSNGAAKLKNALRWLVEFVRYHCLREVGEGKEEEGREESAYRPTEVRLLSPTTRPLHAPACTLSRPRSLVSWPPMD